MIDRGFTQPILTEDVMSSKTLKNIFKTSS